MKVLTVAVPCYNSESYLNRCLNSLVIGGRDVEILVIDDGSTDATGYIAEDYADRYPEIVRVIHEENRGHGGALNMALANAKGAFFKVVDSDDWVDAKSYRKILRFLRKVVADDTELDLFLANYVNETQGTSRKRVMHYHGTLPVNTFFTWDDVGHFKSGDYILMHSVIYRTKLLRDCHLKLPEHTYYVDNLYVYEPMPYVRTMYYMDVMFYRYFIGRSDQSVDEKVMISRIGEQIRVNRLMISAIDLPHLENERQKAYLYHYLEIVTAITSVLLLKSGTKEHLAEKKDLWEEFRKNDPAEYRKVRTSLPGVLVNLPGKAGRTATVRAYDVIRKVFGY